MRTAPAVLASLLSLVSSPAAADCWWAPSADGVLVQPEHPTTTDRVLIQLSGKWPDGCTPRDGQLRREGNDFFFDVEARVGGACPTVVLPWMVSAESPPLAAGTYRLHGRIVGDPLCSPDHAFLQEIVVSDFQFVLGTRSVDVTEGGSSQFSVALLNPMGEVHVAVSISGDDDLQVLAGSELSFDDTNYSVPQTVTLAARQDGDYLDATAVVEIRAPGVLPARMEVREVDDDRPSILHVDALARGSRSGADWANAFTDLQEALALAREYPGSTQVIRVAEGVYRPGPPGGSRFDSRFRLVDGVALEGGYAGGAYADPDRRHIREHETVLSGDLNRDDGPDFANREDNSYNVVDGRGSSASTVLDGFTITGGDGYAQSGGIELMAEGTRTTIRNCILAYNRAAHGAAARAHWGSPTFVNCVFVGNQANDGLFDSGGGMRITGDAGVTLLQCTFIGNVARAEGGGIVNHSPNTRVINCIFRGNSVGGVQDEAAQVNAIAGLFRNNCIQGWTGALGGDGNFGADPLLGGPGGFRLLPGSPCIDAGAAGFEAEAGDTDVDGEPRLVGIRLDVGADESAGDPVPFRRGESNGDGRLDISDAVTLLVYLFGGGGPLTCEKAGDANDDGEIDISDPISVLTVLFFDPEPLSAPYEVCGQDPEPDDLNCLFFAGCEG